MKDRILLFVILLYTMSMGSCTVIGDIFKAGAAVGVIAVIVIVAIVIWIISMLKGKN